MGTIKVDQIEPRATPDQVTIVSTTLTGTTAGSTTITSEGGTQSVNIQQGLVKAWATVNQESGLSTLDSFNHSSVADTRTGQALHTVTTTFSNNDYAMVQSEYDTDGNWTATGGISGAQAVSPWTLAITTSAFTNVRYTSGSQGEDTEYCVHVAGDTA